MTITTIERCGLCGQPIDAGDVDVVQVHGGVGGFMHADCLRENEAANETGDNQKSA